MDTGSELPAQYQYFPNGRLGGKAMEDYCPVWQAYEDWDCRFATADPTKALRIDKAAAESAGREADTR